MVLETWNTDLKLCAPFPSSLPWFQPSIIFILLELMLSPQALMYTGCNPCLQNSNCFPKITSHHHCAFYDALPHLRIWPLLRDSICFPDLQVKFIKTDSFFRFWGFFKNDYCYFFSNIYLPDVNFLQNTTFLKEAHYSKKWAFCTSIKWKLWM